MTLSKLKHFPILCTFDTSFVKRAAFQPKIDPNSATGIGGVEEVPLQTLVAVITSASVLMKLRIDH